MIQAFHTAALFSRVQAGKRLPRLESLLGKPREKKPQSAADQMRIFKMWTAFHGGEIRTSH